jgi:predicted nucleotidyltransferase
MSILDSLRSHRSSILRLAAEHGAEDVRIFGSAVRGQDRTDSDLDLLVRMEPGRTLLDLISLEQDLEDLLGRPGEVVVEGGISPHLEPTILAEARPL